MRRVDISTGTDPGVTFAQHILHPRSPNVKSLCTAGAAAHSGGRGGATTSGISIELGRSFVPLYSSTWKSRHGPLCQGFFARLCLLRGASPEMERAPTEGSITASPLA
jgi:hypothetical protein